MADKAGRRGLQRRIGRVYVLLAIANIAAWVEALQLFHDKPVMLGTALLAWGLGLRHAVDADHIAAIDNVTRKFMQDGEKSVTVGFWYAIGHSAVIATIVYATFLFAMAAMNIVILGSVLKTFNHVRSGGDYVEQDLDMLLARRGVLVRVFRPIFCLVSRSWHMACSVFCSASGSTPRPRWRSLASQRHERHTASL